MPRFSVPVGVLARLQKQILVAPALRATPSNLELSSPPRGSQVYLNEGFTDSQSDIATTVVNIMACVAFTPQLTHRSLLLFSARSYLQNKRSLSSRCSAQAPSHGAAGGAEAVPPSWLPEPRQGLPASAPRHELWAQTQLLARQEQFSSRFLLLLSASPPLGEDTIWGLHALCKGTTYRQLAAALLELCLAAWVSPSPGRFGEEDVLLAEVEEVRAHFGCEVLIEISRLRPPRRQRTSSLAFLRDRRCLSRNIHD